MTDWLEEIEARANAATPGQAEEWRSIVETNGLYEVSDFGNVRSHLKPGNHRNKLGLPRLLKQSDNGNGYKTVSLPIDVGYRHIAIHRLVAKAFLGDCPSGYEVAHLNGDKGDNGLANLAYVTHKENEAHKRLHGTVAIGERNGQAVLRTWQVEEAKYLVARGIPQSGVAALFGWTRQTISEVVNGERWGTVPARTDIPRLIARVRALDERLTRTQHAWRLSDKTFEIEADAARVRIRSLEAALAALSKLEALHRRVEGERIAALAEQVALDGAVVEAAQRLVDSKKRLVYSAGVGAMCVTLAAFGEWSEYETALDAALAALDGERKEGEG